MAIMKIIGVRKMKGQMDGSAPFDFSRIYAIGRLDPTATDRAGYSGIELRGLPKFYQPEFMSLPFTSQGIEFDVEIEQIAIGKGEFRDTVVKMTRVVKQSTASIPPASVPPASPSPKSSGS
jgi:hypothetical protein